MKSNRLPATVSLEPRSREELSHALAQANATQNRVGEVDLRHLRQILQYTPEDMTVTAEAGILLGQLQSHLRSHRQWLPIDPPESDRLSIKQLLDANLSGPRRHGYGTIRDHLIGLRVALADGRMARSGGQVVKNVAGYDLMKLFVGAHGSLGVIVEATFKLLPLPETEAFVGAECPSLAQAETVISAVLESELNPVVFDLHNLFHPSASRSGRCQIVLGFAGAQEDVAWQVSQAAKLGCGQPVNLEYDTLFWSDDAANRHQLSVLPSRLTSAISHAAPNLFVARAGNGLLFYRGGTPPPKSDLPEPLLRRVKDSFDPNHLFPDPLL